MGERLRGGAGIQTIRPVVPGVQSVGVKISADGEHLVDKSGMFAAAAPMAARRNGRHGA
jgi:hypothetical protein